MFDLTTFIDILFYFFPFFILEKKSAYCPTKAKIVILSLEKYLIHLLCWVTLFSTFFNVVEDQKIGAGPFPERHSSCVKTGPLPLGG